MSFLHDDDGVWGHHLGHGAALALLTARAAQDAARREQQATQHRGRHATGPPRAAGDGGGGDLRDRRMQR